MVSVLVFNFRRLLNVSDMKNRAIMLVRFPAHHNTTMLIYHLDTEYKEAFALFDKRGTGAVPRETLGDLLRALGQNPTQAEVAEIIASAPRDGEYNVIRRAMA